MFKKSDPNSFKQFYPLYSGSDRIGYLIADYQVSKYDNVQVRDASSVTASGKRQFVLHCTQRIVISNNANITPSKNTNGYENYPVLVDTRLNVSKVDGRNVSLNVQVLDYSPKTVNTKVQSSGTVGSSIGSANSTTLNNTVGSSTSQSNDYSAITLLGIDIPIEHSTSNSSSKETSKTTGSESSANRSSQSSNADSMSIKDWGAYGFVNPVTKSPVWIFGQEYPWDAIQCRRLVDPNVANPNESSQLQLVVPSDMLLRLYDQVCVYPPSQLSTFGINFVTMVAWLITIDNDTQDEVNVLHTIDYYTASHIASPAGSTESTTPPTGSVAVYIDSSETTLNGGQETLSVNMNLTLMALDVLGIPGKQAIIGFTPSRFTIQPSPATSSGVGLPFKILSISNTLLIYDTSNYPANCCAGAGFSASQTSLTATIPPNCSTGPSVTPPNLLAISPALSMTAYFKVVDTVNDYKLFLKHWMVGSSAVMLTFVINNDWTNTITKYVDDLEAEGGENNLLSISLRNQNFASIEYHDYLQFGLNSIQIIIAPIAGQSNSGCIYQIRAISIEKA